ncbi:MAG: hypothetical protein ACR2MT_05710 [Aurantibacter sp.]
MKFFHPRFKITVVLLSFFILVACSKDSNDTAPDPTFDFSPIEEIANFRGDLTSEIAVVYAQGGPEVFLDPNEINGVVTITNTEDLLTVNVHQAQTLDPDIIAQGDIDFDEAIALDQISVENLEDVIAYLHQSGKKVYLIGVSFGGFLVQKYLADYGTDSVVSILIVASRLNIQEGFWKGFSTGQTGRFEADGVDWSLTDQNDPLDRNISRLAAGVGKNRYIDLFSNLTGLEKLTFVYSTKDDRIGTLDNDEKTFLASKSVNLIPIEASHSETVVMGVVRGYSEGFMLGN